MTHRQKFLAAKSVAKKPTQPGWQDYQTALEYFWRGQKRQVIAFTSERILGKAGAATSASFWLYRLWIEQLAASGDQGSLRQLVEHLFAMGQDLEGRSTWLALRALGHLELDDWQACQLLAPTLAADPTNPYSQEFCFRFALRSAKQGTLPGVPFLSCPQPLSDYFHRVTLAQALLLHSDSKPLATLLADTSQLFPMSPLEASFLTHQAVEARHWGEAARHNKLLSQMYPLNADHYISAGFIYVQAGEIMAAIAALTKALSLKQGRQDADAHALLAYCYQQKAGHDLDSHPWRLAYKATKVARKLRLASGLPITDLVASLASQQRQLQEAQGGPALALERPGGPLQKWVVKLSPRRAYELASAPEVEVARLVVALGTKVREDDLVFFVWQAPHQHERVRILALYNVVAGQGWDPVAGKVSAVTLLKRFEEPLSIDLSWQDLTGQRNSSHAFAKVDGVYHMGDESFHTLTLAVRELVELNSSSSGGLTQLELKSS